MKLPFCLLTSQKIKGGVYFGPLGKAGEEQSQPAEQGGTASLGLDWGSHWGTRFLCTDRVPHS